MSVKYVVLTSTLLYKVVISDMNC